LVYMGRYFTYEENVRDASWSQSCDGPCVDDSCVRVAL